MEPDIYSEGVYLNDKAEEEARMEMNELNELLSSYVGRKFIFRQLEAGWIFSSHFDKSSRGFFNEGKREEALKTFNAILDLDPNIFSNMCVEFRNKND